MSEKFIPQETFEKPKVPENLFIFENGKDLTKMYREGASIINQIKLKEDKYFSDKSAAAKVTLGYFNRLFGGLSKDSLRFLNFVDVGGGSYDYENSIFGPDLAKILAHDGASVTLVDPQATSKDFSPEELVKIQVVNSGVSEYVREGNPKKDFVVSSSLFGSPNFPMLEVEDSSLLFKTLLEMSAIADVQVHTFNCLDINSVEAIKQLQELAKASGAFKKMHLANIFLADQKAMFDFFIIDNRP